MHELLKSTSLVLLVSLAGFSGAATAESTYKSRTTFKTDFQTVDWNGGKVTIGSLKGVGEVYDSNSTSMSNGPGNANCLLKSVRINDASEIVSYCTFTDKDGDITYGISERKIGDLAVGTVGKGKTRYVGGTGKHKNIKGGCEYQMKSMPDNWFMVESSCTID